jgi:tetratricopeptide (TPR) repeat protein
LAAPVLAFVFARREVPSAHGAATWLDVHADASGFVVTEDELGQSSWTPRTEEALERALAALPKPQWRALLAPLSLAVAFASLALWIELPERVIGPPPAVSSAAIARVEEKLDALEEALALEPELEEDLEQRLEAARADSEAGNPESTYEALDQLEGRIEEEAQRAEQAAQQALAELERAASDPSLAKAQEALKSALETLEAAGLSKELSPDAERALKEALAEAAQSGEPLSSAELAQLARELKGGLEAQLGKLANGRLIDPKKLAKLAASGSLDEFDDTHECDEECKQPGGT